MTDVVEEQKVEEQQPLNVEPEQPVEEQKEEPEPQQELIKEEEVKQEVVKEEPVKKEEPRTLPPIKQKGQGQYQKVDQKEAIISDDKQPMKESNNAGMVDGEEGEIDVEKQYPEEQAMLAHLINIVKLTQERDCCEEVDFVQEKGGVEWMITQLAIDQKTGLIESKLQYREDAYGSNKFKQRPPKGFCTLCIEALDDLTMQILIVCSIISIILNGIFEGQSHPWKFWNEGCAILFAVAACTLVAAGNDLQKEKQFAALQKAADDKKMITVVRNSQEVEINQNAVLVGDIVKIVEGMNIPCDGFVLSGIEVKTDESAMTGETDLIKKATLKQCLEIKESSRQDYAEGPQNHRVPSPCLLSGTKIINGEGQFLCMVVGNKSCAGKIRAELTEEEEHPTPLQEKLEVIATDISLFGLVGACFTVFALLCSYIVRSIFYAMDGTYKASTLVVLLDYFIVGIAIIVMAVPEGLPLAVTLSLAFSVKKMLKDNNLVRQLQACETMGGANCICSDKTGTLTQNKMSLTSIWNNKDYKFDIYHDHVLTADPFNFTAHGNELMKVSFIANASAVGRRMIMNQETGVNEEVEASGNKTEIALLNFMDKCKFNYQEVRDQYLSEELVRYPFSSSRKRMTTQVKDLGDGKGSLLLLKGASEIVLSCCDKFHNLADDSVSNLDETKLAEVHAAIKGMAQATLRTLCFAYKAAGNIDKLVEANKHGVYPVEESGFTLFCVTGIKDNLRETVPGSVATCQRAGIKVRMVTGDNADTAEAIAIECGIIQNSTSPDYDRKKAVWIGKEFWEHVGGLIHVDKLDKKGNPEINPETKEPFQHKKLQFQDKFNLIYKDLCVMARSRPEDKLAMVIGLMELRKVVAVTGDGTNDAPALKRSDVGFAMGIAGTEVAREAADIILLDDNFTSIVQAVLWGRNIYDSVRKFLQFQLTINVVAVLCVFVAALETQNSILTAVQMLWVNMIMDTFAALALATEEPHPKLLKRPPHSRDQYIVSGVMLKHILVHTVFQSIVILTFTFGSEFFVVEPLKDQVWGSVYNATDGTTTEQWVVNPELSKIRNDVNQEEVWLKFDNKNSGNPYTLKTEFEANYAVYCKPGDKYIVSGKAYKKFGQEYDYFPIQEVMGPSRQLTLVFNIFVFLQIFNFVNARKIEDELNVFEDMHKSYWFMSIIALIIFLQVLFVQFGSIAVDCNKKGLALNHWCWCFGIGSIGLVVSFFTKVFTPQKYKGGQHDAVKVEAKEAI